MTKRELIEALAEYPDDAEVRIATPRSDHMRTVTATKVGVVTLCDVEYSAYHQEDRIIPADAERLEAPPRQVVVLADSLMTVEVER